MRNFSPDNLWTYVGARTDSYSYKGYDKDPDGNYIINTNGLMSRSQYSSLIGYTDPDLEYGLANVFKYKNFTLTLNFDGRIGGKSWSNTEFHMLETGAHPDTDNQWRYDEVVNGKKNYVGEGVKIVSGEVKYDQYGRITSDTRVFAPNDIETSYEDFVRSSHNNPDKLVQKKTFLKLREMSIGYNLPKKFISKLSMNSCYVGFIGQNLFVLTKDFRFSDPDGFEDIEGEDISSPSIRYVGVNLKVEFLKAKRMKMKNILICGLVLLGMIGCDDFESVNTNPDSTNKVTSAMLATELLRDITTYKNGNGKDFIRDELLAKYLSWTEANDIDLAFNLLGGANYDALRDLRNASKMIDFATNDELKNSYTALSHFVRVFFFFNLTMQVGDIPYSEALRAEDEEVYFPKYDSQKDVFLGLLNELDEADRLFSAGTNFEGDYIYGGDVTKWRKAVNVMQLKLLLNLYKKVDDPDLKVRERINEIINSRPVFESIADNFQVVYSNKAGQKYPYFKEINSFVNNDRMTNLFVDKLKALKDYRLFYYAKPTPSSEEAKLDPSEWDAYGGVDPTYRSLRS